jgi:hypothetical protein
MLALGRDISTTGQEQPSDYSVALDLSTTGPNQVESPSFASPEIHPALPMAHVVTSSPLHPSPQILASSSLSPISPISPPEGLVEPEGKRWQPTEVMSALPAESPRREESGAVSGDDGGWTRTAGTDLTPVTMESSETRESANWSESDVPERIVTTFVDEMRTPLDRDSLAVTATVCCLML